MISGVMWMWRRGNIPHQGNELQIANAVLESCPMWTIGYTSPGGDGDYDPTMGGDYPMDCVEFEELNLADVYGLGDAFSVANSDGSLKFDVLVGGFGTSGAGSASVENGGKAGAMGQELRVNNVTVNFNAPAPNGLSIHFGEYGGAISFSVNGSVINADNFQDLDGQTAGGLTLSVPMGGNGKSQCRILVTWSAHSGVCCRWPGTLD